MAHLGDFGQERPAISRYCTQASKRAIIPLNTGTATNLLCKLARVVAGGFGFVMKEKYVLPPPLAWTGMAGLVTVHCAASPGGKTPFVLS